MVIEVGRETPQAVGLFPLGGDVINRVFARINVVEMSWVDVLNEQTEAMQFENPFALGYLEEVASRFGDGTAQDGFNVGRSLLYLMLCDKSQKGIIPQLSYDFIEGYGKEASERPGRVYGRNDEEKLVRGAAVEHLVRLNMFRLLERDVYDNLDSYLHTKGTLFQNSIFIGMVYSYFLFRQGLSDMANYTQNYRN